MPRTVKLLILTLALFSAGAQATVLTTMPLSPTELGDQHESACLARNPGDAPLEVAIEGFNMEGRRVAALTFDLLPGSTRLVQAREGAGQAGLIASCQFSFSGRASKLEARIIVRSRGSEQALISRLAR